MTEKRVGSKAPRAGPKLTSRSAAPNLLIIGALGLLLSGVLVLLIPKPEGAQAVVLAALLGLSGAFVATPIMGSLKLKTKYIEAGGPFAVFLIFFWTLISAAAPEALAGVPFLGRGR